MLINANEFQTRHIKKELIELIENYLNGQINDSYLNNQIKNILTNHYLTKEDIQSVITMLWKRQINPRTNQIKTSRESFLRHIFKDIPEECLPELYAIAEAYDKPLKSCIYFIRNNYTGRIKIGSTNNIKKRFRELISAFKFVGLDADLELVALKLTFPGYETKIEKNIQNDYKYYQFKNEWYDINTEQIIKDCVEATDKYDFIDGVLIDFSELEYPFFEEIKKDYSISVEEINDEIGVTLDLLEKLKNMLFQPKNPLWEIVETIDKYKVGFGVETYDVSTGQFRLIGIRHSESDKIFTFQELKNAKYDRNYWHHIIQQIKKYQKVKKEA